MKVMMTLVNGLRDHLQRNGDVMKDLFNKIKEENANSNWEKMKISAKNIDLTVTTSIQS